MATWFFKKKSINYLPKTIQTCKTIKMHWYLLFHSFSYRSKIKYCNKTDKNKVNERLIEFEIFSEKWRFEACNTIFRNISKKEHSINNEEHVMTLLTLILNMKRWLDERRLINNVCFSNRWKVEHTSTETPFSRCVFFNALSVMRFLECVFQTYYVHVMLNQHRSISGAMTFPICDVEVRSLNYCTLGCQQASY